VIHESPLYGEREREGSGTREKEKEEEREREREEKRDIKRETGEIKCVCKSVGGRDRWKKREGGER
jgi:hypothetical protein